MRLFLVPVIFLLLAAVFLALAAADFLQHGYNPKLRAWLRIGCIFAIIGIWLSVFHGHFP